MPHQEVVEAAALHLLAPLGLLHQTTLTPSAAFPVLDRPLLPQTLALPLSRLDLRLVVVRLAAASAQETRRLLAAPSFLGLRSRPSLGSF